MAKLTEFIDNYLKNNKIADYEGYIAAYGTDAEKDYAKRIAAADTDYARSLSAYGNSREALRSAGLFGSGYSDYLDGVAYAEHARAKTAAEEARINAESKNLSGYAAYLSKQNGGSSDGVQNAFGKLLSQGIVDGDIAKKYLMTLGVEEKEAAELAGLSLQMQKNNAALRSYALKMCLENMYSYNISYRYALALGMSEAAAKDLANEVKAYRDAYFDDYYDRD